ncbi:response regulator transcription factor [Streptomyces sp. NPDC050548]|uniref:response regulator transcription factor n=1 Tax=Streptomyces sp. NPDC050548 TaxID=3365629 RepID=UPI0037A01B8E
MVCSEEGSCSLQRCETLLQVQRSLLLWKRGRLDASMKQAVEATESVCTRHRSAYTPLAHLWHAWLLGTVRHLPQARRALAGAAPRDGAFYSAELTAMVQVTRATVSFAEGSLDAAVSEVHEALRIGVPHTARGVHSLGHVLLVQSALRQGDPKAALHSTKELANDALLGTSLLVQAQSAWAAAQTAEAYGGAASAEHLISGLVNDRTLLRRLLAAQPSAASWLVRGADKLGASSVMKRTVSTANALAESYPQYQVLRASGLHAAGWSEKDPGKLRRAAGLYPEVWLQASAREDLGTLLARHRAESEQAVGHLKGALDGYTATGAPRDAHRVMKKLRYLGVRYSHARLVVSDRIVGHGLTEEEFAVAELVSQGFTNSEVGRKLFISQHTVAFHLRKVFQKMEVGSRVELAVAWNTSGA